MSKTLKVLLAIIASILLLLVLTNPSYKDFKEYSADYNITAHDEYGLYHNVVRRKLANYFVYSVYQQKTYQRQVHDEESSIILHEHHRYIAILDNFFEIEDF